MSAGVGWKESVFSSNFGVSLYKRGAVRVTILKERNGNFAKIKLSHLASQGYSIGGKVRGETQIIEGIFFGSDLSVSMIPFRISMNTADIKIFDSVYRYDMRTPLGQEAYEKAVLGNFILSEEEGLKNQDISKLYDKDTKTKSNTFDMNYNLLIWRHQKRFQLDNSLITITDDEGVNHIFKSMSKNEVETGNLFHGRDEVFEYFIDTAFELEDPEHPIKSIDPAVSISILMSDRHAYGSQLRRHFQMMENILQDPQFFDEGQYAVETDYRKMSLQFTVNFYLNAIDHILEASPDDVWKAIAKAYGVSPSDWETEEKRNEWVNFETYFMGFLRIRSAIEKIRLMRNATEIVKYFGRIKSQVDPRERAMLLSQFHHDNGLDWHVLTVMLLLADKEDMITRMNNKISCIELTNPVNQDYNVMRPWVLPSLIKILSAEYSLHSDHLQFLCPSNIDLNLIPFNVAFCCSKTSLSSIFFMKIKYDICSIACNGLLMPPLQNLSHNFLIFDFSSACSMV